MAKRKLPLKLKLNVECARAVGIKPFKKWTASQHKQVDSCIVKKMRARGK